MKTLMRGIFRKLGYDIVRYKPDPYRSFPDLTEADRKIIDFAAPFTQTHTESLYALMQAVRYLHKNRVEGALVECGVWKGGSMIAAARTLLALDSTSRDLYLFDTFEGMSAPTPADVDYLGTKAEQYFKNYPKFNVVPLEEVTANMEATRYPREKMHFVKGKVEDTLPARAPKDIALLRLDTDWYESTRHELMHLFPRLVPYGVLIIDDYGHFQGCRRAVDEYFAGIRTPVFLHRVDYTCRIAIKPPA